MPEIITEGGGNDQDLKQNPFKALKEKFQSLDKFYKTLVLTTGIFVLFATVISGKMLLQTRNFASENTESLLTSVEVNPGSIQVKVGEKSVGLSALAYDIAKNPMYDNSVTYEWGTSSTNSIGTLTKTEGNITEFIPKTEGWGELHVIARAGTKSVDKSIQVIVTDNGGAIPPKPTPSSTEPTQTPLPPIVLSQQQLTITNYTPTISVNPGEQVKLLTITSNGAPGFTMYGYPTTYGPGINFIPSSGGLSNGSSIDIYVQVNSNIPPGIYSGIPQVRSTSLNVSAYLPQDSIYVGLPLPTFTITPNPIPSKTPTPKTTHTPTPTPSYHVTKVYPSADSYVAANTPNKNFGAATQLAVDGSPKSISYFKFQLPNLTGKKLNSTTLVLRVPNVSGADSKGTFRLKVAGSNWTETGVNYSNRPTLGAVIVSQPQVERQTTYGFIMSSYAQYHWGQVIYLGVDTDSSDGTIFLSKEGSSSTRPYIEISYWQ